MITLLDMTEWLCYTRDALVARWYTDTNRKARALLLP